MIEISKFTMICLENLGGKSFSQEIFFFPSNFRRPLQSLLLRYTAEILQVNYLILFFLFCFVLTTFHRTNKLFLCLQKVDQVTNYCKRRIQSNFIVNISLLIKNLLG